MYEWLKALLSSKRVQATIISIVSSVVIVVANEKLGLHLTEEQVREVVTTILGAIGALVLADSVRPVGISHEEARLRTKKKINRR